MQFYETLPETQKESYRKFIGIIGSLSRLFSENNSPYFDSRIAENIFCKCFKAENLARDDSTADAKIGDIGIGIKTWVGDAGSQKIAEFNKSKNEYGHLNGLDKVRKIAELRNARIEFTLRQYGLSKLIYHVTIREPGFIKILECPLEKIDVDNLSVLSETGKSIQFTDGKNHYNFYISKSVLLMKFDKLVEKDRVGVSIFANPYKLLEETFGSSNAGSFEGLETGLAGLYGEPENPFIYLKLYSYRDRKTYDKFVPEKSGLNQWNASGRPRNPDEIYIPISREDHKRSPHFFPDRDSPFTLILPDGKTISAKVCQDNSKALMSNPNSDLGKWLLREVLRLKPGTLVDYRLFIYIGIDSVRIEKISNEVYKINFAKLDSYENWMSGYRDEDIEE